MAKQFVQLSQYQAAYWEEGTGIPLIFLHGFLGESRAWLPIMSQLGQYRCIALDLLGFGASAKPALKYTIWHQVEFLQEFLQAIAIDKSSNQSFDQYYLIGHSYGGWAAAAFALKHAVKGLVLIAPAGIRDDSFVGRYNHLRPLLWEHPMIDWTLGAIAPVAKLIGKASEFQVIYDARQALVAQPVAKSFLYDRLRPEDAIDTLENDIAQINTPALVIAGAKDDTIPLWHAQTYGDRLGNAQIEILENATHALIQTHALEISGFVQRFCN